jgi:putative membrane protein
MEIAANIFIIIVVLIHLYILWFEMFAWTSRGPKVFRGFPKDLFPKTVAMAANQGLYNGFLAAGLIWSFFIEDPIWSDNIALFFLSCVLVAGIYGTFTASKKIFFVQALPALLAIVLTLL